MSADAGARRSGDGPRHTLLDRIADHLLGPARRHPLRVGVDGITAAGKSTLARQLTGVVSARGVPAIHLSMDDWHHPRAYRYRQGRDSAHGYLEDAYDHRAFGRLVLDPLGPDGDRSYVPRLLDLSADEPYDDPAVTAPGDAVVIVDGSFLQVETLAARWDDVIFLDVDFDTARGRGSLRDADAFGGLEAAERAFRSRYHAAARMYLEQVDPRSRASIVVDHQDPARPVLRRIGGPARGAGTIGLFSYGTLQQREVQLATFGHTISAQPDAIVGYRTDAVQISDPAVLAASGLPAHPILRHTGDVADRVPGSRFLLTAQELAAADSYEVADYARALLPLESGGAAWTYVART